MDKQGQPLLSASSPRVTAQDEVSRSNTTRLQSASMQQAKKQPQDNYANKGQGKGDGRELLGNSDYPSGFGRINRTAARSVRKSQKERQRCSSALKVMALIVLILFAMRSAYHSSRCRCFSLVENRFSILVYFCWF